MKLTKQFVYVSLFEFINLLFSLYIIKIVSHNFTKLEFSEYNIFKRIISFLLPFLLMGMTISIPKYMALNTFEKEKYFISGSLFLISFSTIFILILYLYPNLVSSFLIGEKDQSKLIQIISIVLFGSVLTSICYSYFRGSDIIIKGSIFQFIIATILPTSLIFVVDNIKSYFFLLGIGYILISVLILSYFFYKISFKNFKISSYLKETLSFSLKVIPSDFGIATYFFLPSFLALQKSNIIIGGEYAFATSLVVFTSGLFAPVGLIMLTHTSILISNKEFYKIYQIVIKIIITITILSVIGIIIFQVFANEILNVLFGVTSQKQILLCKLFIICSFPYSIFVSLRSIIDALYSDGRNAKNVIIALISFMLILTTLGFNNLINVAYAFISSMFVLSILTIYSIKKVIKKNFNV